MPAFKPYILNTIMIEGKACCCQHAVHSRLSVWQRWQILGIKGALLLPLLLWQIQLADIHMLVMASQVLQTAAVTALYSRSSTCQDPVISNQPGYVCCKQAMS